MQAQQYPLGRLKEIYLTCFRQGANVDELDRLPQLQQIPAQIRQQVRQEAFQEHQRAIAARAVAENAKPQPLPGPEIVKPEAAPMVPVKEPSAIQPPVESLPTTPRPRPSEPESIHTRPASSKPSSHKEEGERLIGIISRTRGIDVKFEWLGCDEGVRVKTHKIRQVNDPKVPLLPPERLEGLGPTLRYWGFVPEGSDSSIRVSHGCVAIEIPKQTWEPILITSLKQRRLNSPLDPFLIRLGRDNQNRIVEMNLSRSTGTNVLIAGMTGSGKNGAMDTVFFESVWNYPPSYVQFVGIDVQEVNFQHYERFHPWHWKGIGIISNKDDIKDLIHWDESDESGGIIWDDTEYRKKLFRRARKHGYCTKLEEYNEIAWKLQTDEFPFLPRVCVFTDEAPAVKDKVGSSYNTSHRKLTMELRKFGYHFITGVQRPVSGLFDVNSREQYGHCIGLQCKTASTSEKILGDDFKEARKLEGEGDAYFVAPGVTSPIRIQLFYSPPQLVDQLSAAVRKRYPDPPVALREKEPLTLPQEVVPAKSVVSDEDREAWERVKAVWEAPDRSNNKLIDAAFGPNAAKSDYNGNKNKLTELLIRIGRQDVANWINRGGQKSA